MLLRVLARSGHLQKGKQTHWRYRWGAWTICGSWENIQVFLRPFCEVEVGNSVYCHCIATQDDAWLHSSRLGVWQFESGVQHNGAWYVGCVLLLHQLSRILGANKTLEYYRILTFHIVLCCVVLCCVVWCYVVLCFQTTSYVHLSTNIHQWKKVRFILYFVCCRSACGVIRNFNLPKSDPCFIG